MSEKVEQLNLVQLKKLDDLFRGIIGEQNELAYGTIVMKLILEKGRTFEQACKAVQAAIAYGVIMQNEVKAAAKRYYELTYYLSDSTPF